MITQLQKRIEQMTDMLQGYQSGDLLPVCAIQVSDSARAKGDGLMQVSVPDSCIGKRYRVILMPE